MLLLARVCSILCALALVACSATDVVARRLDGCEGAGCADGGVSACRAESCSALSSRTQLCQAGAIHVQSGDSCTADGQLASRYALCTCSDLVTSALLSVDAFRGALSQSPRTTPSLGVNGDLTLQGAGTLDAELVVRGRIAISDQITTARTPTQVSSDPCECGSSALLDIDALVSAHARDNDNAAAGISSEQLNGFRGSQQLTLDCGRYYFTRMKGDEPIAIRTRGNVAIFVASNIELNDALSIESEGDGQVSLVVAGDMRVGGSLSLGGDPNGRARADLYLASTGTLEIAGSTDIRGKLYAPRAELVSSGTFQIYGSLFVRRAAPTGEVHIHYDELAANPVRCNALP